MRDLWALRLQRLQNRVSYDSETETEGQSQLFSSQSEGEGSASASQASRRSRRRSRTKTDGSPNILETLCLCYIGLLLLREPVTVADVYAWASSGELLYYRASKEVPLGMRERLPATYQDLLEPQQVGRPQKLHKGILDILFTLRVEFGMALPPINHLLILYRWIRELALPVEVFAAVQRFARIFDLHLSYELDVKAGRKDVVLRYPEAILGALVVVATKLLFPFDGAERYPAYANDMSALLIDWPAWADLQSRSLVNQEAPRGLSHQTMMEFSQSDALETADDQLDQYLDWCEDNVATEDIREHGKAGKDADFRRMLFRLFPAGRDEARPTARSDETVDHEHIITERLRQAQGALKLQRIVEQKTGPRAVDRVGSYYRRVKAVEDLEGPMRLFHERVARLAGLSQEVMVRAVLSIERKLQKQEERLRRTGDESDTDED